MTSSTGLRLVPTGHALSIFLIGASGAYLKGWYITAVFVPLYRFCHKK